MKIKLTFLLACTMLVNFSCAKKTAAVDEPVAPVKVKLLTRVIASSMSPPATTYTTTFTDYSYDDQKRLISIKSGGNETVFYYNDRGEMYKKTAPFGPSSHADTEVAYENGHIKSATVKNYSGNIVTSEILYGYIYSGDNITEIDVNQNGLRLRSYKFEFSNNKPVKVVCDDPTYPFFEEFTYDDKKSAFDSQAKNVRNALNLPFGPFCDNNILTDKMTFTTITSGTTRSLVYTYDEDGWPKTTVGKAGPTGATNPSESRITCEYTLF